MMPGVPEIKHSKERGRGRRVSRHDERVDTHGLRLSNRVFGKARRRNRDDLLKTELIAFSRQLVYPRYSLWLPLPAWPITTFDRKRKFGNPSEKTN